ncbi:hypothetical protein MUN77_15810 [Leucobacter allii]|uniref:hypothetical protein n=1 Tax=Leucobacter allii TaxID=2932247 RepID=UPI001FD1CCCB|nr:hypothetical protein [Leucobacter allii]UOR01570.1 hypothetical protein MUN77_15810 [Leucobacter allii]
MGDGAERPEIVSYDGLPAASGGAHGLRAKNPRAARERVDAFLAACTVGAEPRWDLRIARGGPVPLREGLRAFAVACFGGPARSGAEGETWRVPASLAPEALERLSAADLAGAVNAHGQSLAVLSAQASVRLRDPGTGLADAGVTPEACGGFAVDGYGRLLGASGVRAAYGTSGSTLSLWLCLPGDARLEAAAVHLAAHAPVRLSAKHWRRWIPLRGAEGYRSRRIPSPVR